MGERDFNHEEHEGYEEGSSGKRRMDGYRLRIEDRRLRTDYGYCRIRTIEG